MFGSIFSKFCLFLFIFILSIQSILTLLCYECDNCIDITSCICNNLSNTDTTKSYCALERENIPDGGVNVYIRHYPRNITSYYIYDPYYISVTETIFYDKKTERWLTESNKVTYACQTDRCNRADLLKQLPSNGFSLMLSSEWLNENLQHQANKNTTLCRECPAERICGDATSPIDLSKCDVHECQGTCTMEEDFNEAETTKYCYQSFCTDSTGIGPDGASSQVEITAIYYINTQRFDIVQISVMCNGNDCSRLMIFQDIKEKLQKDLNGIKPFLPTNDVNSIYSTSFLFFILILLQGLIF